MNQFKKSIVAMVFMLCVCSYAQSLKVMTYNIRLDVASDGANDWNHRKDDLTAQIQFYEPDILGLQEARPNQVLDMTAGLGSYAVLGIGREGIGKGESSNIFYKKARFSVKESNTFWLSETPGEISKGWDAAYNRVCTYALLRDVKTKQWFWVFNTHLDHMGEEARTKGIQLILSKIKEGNSRKYPVIFMGDFNSEPDEERIIALKKEMDDSREVSREQPFGPVGTFNNFRHDQPVTRRIDYIFISKNSTFDVQKYAVLSDSKDLRYPSDHLPVYVEINCK